jgi:hypothetical protein
MIAIRSVGRDIGENHLGRMEQNARQQRRFAVTLPGLAEIPSVIPASGHGPNLATHLTRAQPSRLCPGPSIK